MQMFKKIDNRSKLTIGSDAQSAQIAEYIYLNNLTIMRTDTTHYVWFGSIVAEGVIINLLLQKESSYLLCGSIVLMVPFVLSMAFQLKYIYRIRTYVATFISPRLMINYDKLWNSTINDMKNGIGIVGMKGAANILLLPYYFYSIFTLLLSIEINSNARFPKILTLKYMEYIYKVLSDNYYEMLIWLIANTIFLFAANVLVKSHGMDMWDKCVNEWNKHKREVDLLNFNKSLFLIEIRYSVA